MHALLLISPLNSYHGPEGISKQDSSVGGMVGLGHASQSTSQSESVKAPQRASVKSINMHTHQQEKWLFIL